MFRIIGFILSLVLLAGCVDEVAAPEGVDEPYTIYGILNPRLSTQSMLVAPPVRYLAVYPETIDAIVTSTNLATGESITWRDSVVTGRRGQRDHIFVAPFRPEFGSRHRVRVVRSDGEASTAEADVPGHVTFELDDDGTRYFEGRLLGDSVRLHRAEIVYGVRYYRPTMPPDTLCAQPLEHYSFPLKVSETHEAQRWKFKTNMHENWDYARSYYHIDHGVYFFCQAPPCWGLALMDVELDVTIGGETWDPPGGEFDLHAMSSPEALRNVHNGFGFVGGGYNQELSVWPSKEAIDDSWFYDLLMRPPGVCRDFCTCGY